MQMPKMLFIGVVPLPTANGIGEVDVMQTMVETGIGPHQEQELDKDRIAMAVST